MSTIPAEHETSAGQTGGLMTLVYSWLDALPPTPDTEHRRRAALRRELDALAWCLVGRLVGPLDEVDPSGDAVSPELPLDRGAPSD